MMVQGGRKRNSRTGAARRFTLLVAAVVLIAVALAVVVPRLLPADRLAGRVGQALAAATGAQVEVGAARLSLVGGPGLHLRDVRFQSGAAGQASLTKLEVSLAVWPLVQRRVVIDGLRAEGRDLRWPWQGQSLAATDFVVRADRFHLPVPLGDIAAATGGTRGAAPSPAPVAAGWIPAGVAGDFALSAATARWSTFELEKLEITGGVERRALTVHSLTAVCGGGQLEAAGTIDFAADPAGAFDGGMRVDAVASGPLLGAWAPELAAQLAVPLTGSVRTACRLGDAAVVRATLVADGRLTGGEGVLHAGPWLGDVAPYLGDRRDLVDIRVRELQHVFRVADGRYLVDTLTIDGPDTGWELNGSAGLDGDLDLLVHVRLPAGFTPKLGAMTFFAEALRDDDRRVNLDFRLRGPLPDPAVTLDLSALARKAKRPAPGTGGAGETAPGTPSKGLGALLDKWKVK